MKTIIIILFLFAAGMEGSKAQTVCDEAEVSRIESIKNDAEAGIANARSVTKDTDNGYTVTAYYDGSGKLLKLRAESNLSNTEQVYFENDKMCYYENSGYRSGEMFFEACYFSGNSLFCRKNVLSGSGMKISRKLESKIVSRVEKYLEEIQ
ncbi:MAG: hypothetical protein IAE90_15750 [Ignavibacteria bacterium]|nr:hypothetical protein [Ignavibacteria bacterium]